MTIASSGQMTLEAFLALPETQPASEFIEGKVFQKPMPKSRHSRIQGKLAAEINNVTEPEQIAFAFPELRCTVGGRSLVPDIAVLKWGHIELDSEGEPVEDVMRAPDWVIEILSPDQSANRVAGKILHCLQWGCQLGWLVDPGDRSVMVLRPKQEPQLLEGDAVLRGLTGTGFEVTAAEVFGWLRMGR